MSIGDSGKFNPGDYTNQYAGLSDRPDYNATVPRGNPDPFHAGRALPAYDRMIGELVGRIAALEAGNYQADHAKTLGMHLRRIEAVERKVARIEEANLYKYQAFPFDNPQDTIDSKHNALKMAADRADRLETKLRELLRTARLIEDSMDRASCVHVEDLRALKAAIVLAST